MKILATLALTVCLGLAALAQTPPPAAPAADVAGTWDVIVNSAEGPVSAQLKLTKGTDNKLAGTISSYRGTSPVEAEIKGKALAIWFEVAGQSGPIPIEMNGTAEGDAIKGTMAAGGQTAGDWTATRAKDPNAKETPKEQPKDAAQAAPPKVDLTGTWTVTVELPGMTANPGIVLKQDGEKLTGDYISAQYGKYAITGTLKGTDVTFWFAMNVEGTALNVTYTGTVEKDGTLKGSVNYGDMMSGTFYAEKKK